MGDATATLAQEFEVLVRRGARLGHLSIAELSATWRPLTDDPTMARQLDLASLLGVCHALPHALLQASRLLLVTDINNFSHTPLMGKHMRCGLMDDGALLGEAQHFGQLVRWAAWLCALQNLRTHAESLLWQAQGGPTAAAPADLETPAHIAMALGCDETTWQHACVSAGCDLLAWLAPSPPLSVTIHAQCDPTHSARRAQAQAHRMLQWVAELGLVDRPVHLWLGQGSVTERLSPYTRDLRHVLWRWAQEHPHDVGADVDTALRSVDDATRSEDTLYALTRDFLGTDAALLAEQQDAERTLGLHSRTFGALGAQLIDFARADFRLADMRLGALPKPAVSPILLRVQTQAGHDLGAVLPVITQALGAQVVSISVAPHTRTAATAPSGVYPVRLLSAWGEPTRLPVPGYSTPLMLAGFDDVPMDEMTATLLPSLDLALLLPWQHHGAEPHCLQEGDMALLQALHAAIWKGELRHDTDIAWVGIDAERTDSGRPSVEGFRVLSAFILARLRRMLAPSPSPAPGTPGPTPVPPPPPGASSGRNTAWALRIKA